MTTTSPKTTKSTKTGSSQEDPVDMTTSDSNVGEKRKATTDSTSDSASATKNDGEEEGKDLVEKKQTTLDDIVHSEKDKQPAGSQSKSEDKEERPAKKSKTEESSAEVKEKDKDEVKEREEKVKEREEKVKEKEEKVEMKTAPSKSESKSTTQTEKPTTSPSNPESKSEQTTTDTEATKSDQTPVQAPSTNDTTKVNAENGETVPGDEAHLDHPENWTTGGDPATDKQKGFLKVLEKQKGVPVGDLGGIGKSEASEKIDELKNMCEFIHCLLRI